MTAVSGDLKRGNSERRALGKGLDSLLPKAPSAPAPVAEKAEETGRPMEIRLEDIERNPFQTRTQFDELALEGLAASIRATGVIQPILVRPLGNGRYQLIAGERRWLASHKAEKLTIPAVLRQVSDEQALEMTIIENLQRADLNPMEQAKAYERLGREFGMTQAQMAFRTGKDRVTVGNYVRMLNLPESVQEKLANGILSFSHARLLLALSSKEEMEKAAKQMLLLSLSVRQAESYIQDLTTPKWNRKTDAGPPAPAPAIDPNVQDAQDRLQRALGLRVRIEDKRGRGRVIIEYARLEDFDAVMDLIAGKKG